MDIVGREVGNEIVIARRVLSSDSFQPAFQFHGLRFGCRCQVDSTRTINDKCALGFQLFNVLLDILGHHLAFWNDECLVARASCRLQPAVFIGRREQ